MNRRVIGLIVVALLVGTGLGALLISVFDGDSDEQVAGPDTTTTTTAPVSETGQELLDLLARGRERPFHAVYVQEAEDDATLTVELWRDGEMIRQDIVVEGQGIRSQLASFQLPDGNATCQRGTQGSTETDWKCARAISTATEEGEPAGLIEAAAADLGGKDVSVRDDTIDDVDVRCFLIEVNAAQSSEICVDEGGIPRRVSAAEQELVIQALEDDVDADAFELPAPVPEDPETSDTSEPSN